MKDIYEIGEMPPIGQVPQRMYAQVIRQERFGEPTKAFQIEPIAVPDVAPDEVLVYVMAAGVNYNNVWAALGIPIDVIKARQKTGEPEPFHIGGSDASGIVFRVGKDVRNSRSATRSSSTAACGTATIPSVQVGQRSDVQPDVPHLGLRVELGQLRAVHQGAGPPVPARSRST